MFSKQEKQKAIRLYKDKSLTITEISNLTGISKPSLDLLYRECFKTGELTPRYPHKALKPSPLRFTKEQENEIAYDYYEQGFSSKMLFEKWGIHPMQLQRIRNKYNPTKKKKKSLKIKAVLQYDKEGNFVKEFDNPHRASTETNICYSGIYKCLKCQVKTAGNFIWKYKE